nr:hypothetical protein 59 [bacterium]
MSELGFIKVGYSNSSVVQEVSADTVRASPMILERLEKFAQASRVLAPKSDDFLYFTIIFLKSAEAALIDDDGNLRKVGSERAWGYFDENYKWHGNIQPHRNNNGDIFPEAELKKASRDWIGMPLCVDHKSESVDGIRGIILDTYYDEKHKQVVGLCALDKINYPNLARKVQTGVVRYGSMGTAVTTSICSDCGNRATTPKEYCIHVTSRSAYGEVNVGLKPMEYSLVVQPAEPGARLLRCIASIGEHKTELANYGVEDFDSFASGLSLGQAEELDQILKVACGPKGCSVEQRQAIVGGYLHEHGLVKTADMNVLTPAQERNVQFAKALSQLTDAGASKADIAALYESFGKPYPGAENLSSDRTYENEMSTGQGETLTSGQSAVGRPAIETFDVENVRGTGGESTGMVASDSGEHVDTFQTGGVGPETYAFSSLDKDKTHKSIMEEIMDEANLKKRAELRRRIAYYYGGASGEGSAEPVEPSTFTSEDYKKYWMDDKQMHQTKPMGGVEGMFPGDKEVKEQQKRAKLAERRLQRRAYFYGGAAGEGSAEPVEPPTFKSEDYKKYWMNDKQMHQDGSMGGDTGAFPGDIELKKSLKRARLSTKFKQVRALNGQVNKAASCFEVYADDKLILATTAKDIYGPKLDENWEFLTSKNYGKAVVAAIRSEGLRSVATKLTKVAAEGDPLADLAPLAEEGAPAPEGEEMPPLDEEMPPLGEEGPEELPEAEEEDPKARVDEALVTMEEAVSDIRGALEEMGGGGDVEINVETGTPEAEQVALSSRVLNDLKVVMAESSESADELALISEAYENRSKISAKKLAELKAITADALADSAQLAGEAKTLLRMARVVSQSLVKTSEYVEEAEPVAPAATETSETKEASNDESELYSKALELRKQRRLAMLEGARKKFAMENESEADDACATCKCEPCECEAEENEASDTNSAEDGAAQAVAEKAPAGGQVQAVPGDKAPTEHARQVAEKSPTGNLADDGALNASDDEKMEEIAEEEAEEEVEGHESEMHENEAHDVVPNDGVQDAGFVTEQIPSPRAKLGDKLMQKKAEEERESVKLRMRRAYDLAMDMQRKGLIPPTRAALDSQVDLVLEFDDKAFEAFKRSVANARTPETVKTASDLGGLNVGYEAPEDAPQKSMVEKLSSLFN